MLCVIVTGIVLHVMRVEETRSACVNLMGKRSLEIRKSGMGFEDAEWIKPTQNTIRRIDSYDKCLRYSNMVFFFISNSFMYLLLFSMKFKTGRQK